MIITAETITAWPQARELRTLRNECRHFMTGSTEPVSLARQRAFFEREIRPGHVHGFLLREGDAPACAYALLRPDTAGEYWLSCGVAETARGKGRGSAVVRLATAAGHDLNPSRPVRLAVWEDNHAARRVYLKAGYVLEGEEHRDGRVIHLMAFR